MKAAIQTVANRRHREFHAQRKVTDPVVRAETAARIAIGLPHTIRERPDSADALEADGFFELGRMLEPSQIEDIRDHFRGKPAHDLKRPRLGKFLAPEHAPPESHGAEYGHRDVLDAPHLLGVANDPHLLALVESYLGATPVIAALRVSWNLPTHHGQPEETEFFHRDMDDFRFLKLFVYLTDVDAGSGPHVFAKGSHRKNVLTDLRRFSEQEDLEELGEEALVRFMGKAGTTFLEATYGVHKATPPVARPRLAFQVLYTMRPTIYGPPVPLRDRTVSGTAFSRYTNQIYLRG